MQITPRYSRTYNCQPVNITMQNYSNLVFMIQGLLKNSFMSKLFHAYRTYANRMLALYQNLQFVDCALWSVLAKRLSNMKVFWDDIMPKLTAVRPKRVS